VRIVAIVAVDQLLVHAMPIRTAEFRPLLGMTLITKQWCLLDQQRSLRLCMMRRMTIQAADAIRRMGRTREIRVFRIACMTGQAPGAGVLHTQVLETDDLCDIAAALDVRGAGSVTRFTTVPFHSANLLPRFQQIAVRRQFQVVEQILVAALAYIRADVLRPATTGYARCIRLGGCLSLLFGNGANGYWAQ
jgi:hypothetical protein